LGPRGGKKPPWGPKAFSPNRAGAQTQGPQNPPGQTLWGPIRMFFCFPAWAFPQKNRPPKKPACGRLEEARAENKTPPAGADFLPLSSAKLLWGAGVKGPSLVWLLVTQGWAVSLDSTKRALGSGKMGADPPKENRPTNNLSVWFCFFGRGRLSAPPHWRANRKKKKTRAQGKKKGGPSPFFFPWVFQPNPGRIARWGQSGGGGKGDQFWIQKKRAGGGGGGQGGEKKKRGHWGGGPGKPPARGPVGNGAPSSLETISQSKGACVVGLRIFLFD